MSAVRTGTVEDAGLSRSLSPRHLSNRRDTPKSWGRVSKAGVPQVAVLASIVVGFLTVALNFVVPDEVFSVMLNTSGAIALFVWLAIACAQLRMRRKLERENPERLVLKMWPFPYLTWVAIVVVVVGVVRQRRSPERSAPNTE